MRTSAGYCLQKSQPSKRTFGVRIQPLKRTFAGFAAPSKPTFDDSCSACAKNAFIIIGMRFEIVTIFPGFFTSFFEHGIVRRELAEDLVTVGVHDLRAFTHDRHRTVDDRPFGGGEGMVLKPEPLFEAVESLLDGGGTTAPHGTAIVLLSASGKL